VKFITSINGISGFRAPPDDITPKESVAPAALIQELVKTFSFSVVPPVTGQSPLVQGVVLPTTQITLSFEHGQLEDSGQQIPIMRLFVTGNGAVAVTATTDLSDTVISKLVSVLNEKFGFLIHAGRVKHDHVSNVVVEFEEDFEKSVSALRRITEAINEVVQPSEALRYQFKRLAFGRDFGPLVIDPAMLGLDAADRVDFILERRSQEPYSRNRYFSSAPLTTEQHISLLNKLENIIRHKPR